MGLKAINSLLKPMVKNISHVVSKVETTMSKPIGFEVKQLTGDVVQFGKSVKTPNEFNLKNIKNERTFSKIPEALKEKKTLPKKKVGSRKIKRTIVDKKSLIEESKQEFKKFTKPMIKSATEELTVDFASKKQNLIRELSKVCDKNIIARIEKADTPEKLAKILVEQDMAFLRDYYQVVIEGNFINANNLVQGKSFGKITLDLEQWVYKARAKHYEFVLAREKAMYIPSKNPQVIAIENILKEQYGMKFVSLKDNEALAKNVLKACETASKNGITLPENVVATNFEYMSGENILFGERGMILLNPNKQNLTRELLSTNSEFHIPLHEIMHGTHPKLISYSEKKIPKHLLPVKEKLSGYSAKSPTHETFTELNTKRITEGLNPQEQELFDYLNIFAS